MNVTLVNMTTIEVPVTCTQDAGAFMEHLDPGVAYDIDDSRCTVVTVGDNRTLRDDLAKFAETVLDAFVRLVTFWREHAPKSGTERDAPIVVKVNITNRGPLGVRVLQGDDRSLDFDVPPGVVSLAQAEEFIEIRELGGTRADESNTDQAG